MKKIFLFLISFLIGILIFAWIVKSVGWEEIKSALLMFTGWGGIVILVLTLLILLIATFKWQLILKNTGESVSFFELFKTYLAGFSLMYFFPMVIFGGEILRGYTLKKKYSIKLSKGMACSIIDRILDWTTILVIVFLGIIFFLFKIGLPPKRIVIILGAMFVLLLSAVFFFYFKTFKKESIINSFLKIFKPPSFKEGLFAIEKEFFIFFDSKNINMWKGFFLAFLGGGIYFLRAWLLVDFLGKQPTALSVLSILSFSFLAGMLPLPASLGSREAFQAFTFKTFSMGANFGTVYAMITRGAEIIWALVGVFIVLNLGFKWLGRNFLNNKNGRNENF